MSPISKIARQQNNHASRQITPNSNSDPNKNLRNDKYRPPFRKNRKLESSPIPTKQKTPDKPISPSTEQTGMDRILTVCLPEGQRCKPSIIESRERDDRNSVLISKIPISSGVASGHAGHAEQK